MCKTEIDKKNTSKKWMLVSLFYVLFDILIVNFSYYFAILVRFYVNFQLDERIVTYIPYFFKFVPYYTVICIIIFAIFKLYSGVWRYAGLNDLNRIVLANICTFIVQVLGTVLFVRRMPISYYILGAIIQLILIVGSRFAYRFFVFEIYNFRKKRGEKINAIIVGVDETSRMVIKQLESSNNVMAKPVCIIDVNNRESGRNLEGIPIVGGIDNIRATVEKYNAKYIIIADVNMEEEIRNSVKDICIELDVDFQDFTVYFQSDNGNVVLRGILEHISGNVVIVLDDKKTIYDNGEKALMELPGKYLVTRIGAEGDRIIINLSTDKMVINDTKTEWAKTYVEETGEEISFF